MLEREREAAESAALEPSEGVKDEPQNDAGDDPHELEDAGEAEEDEVQRAAARRRRLAEEEEDHSEADAEDADGAKRPRTEDGSQAGAMKQGLQEWAARVNAMVGDSGDEELAQRCRDFVRQ